MASKRPNVKPKNVKESRQAKKDKRKQALLNALKATLGNVTAACQEANVGRDFFYQCFNNDADFRKQASEIEETCLDFYEGKLHELVDSLNPTSVMFALKCKGKKRGWTEKTEIINTEQISSDDIDFDAMTKEDRDKFIELTRKYQKKSE
jgi:hypothetical protein